MALELDVGVPPRLRVLPLALEPGALWLRTFTMTEPRFRSSVLCGTIPADAACQRSRLHRGAPAPSLSYSQTSVARRCTATTSCPSLPAAIPTARRCGFANATTRASSTSPDGFSGGSAVPITTHTRVDGTPASAGSTDWRRNTAPKVVRYPGVMAIPAAAWRSLIPSVRGTGSLAASRPSAAGTQVLQLHTGKEHNG